ncbi:hypothetical protein J6590_104807, partial [Homalodisca vitripennis]
VSCLMANLPPVKNVGLTRPYVKASSCLTSTYFCSYPPKYSLRTLPLRVGLRVW